MTDEERAELNQALIDAGRSEMVQTDAEGAHYLCNIVKVQKIDDITAFADIYGVVIA